MLRSLYIRNYLLVRELRLEFASGLTAITGETGAGKSMIIGALDVSLGARFPKDSIGPHGDRAVIEVTFARPKSILASAVESDDLELDEWIIRREIAAQGRTRSFFNDRPVSSDTILMLRGILADFHGQREHQSLFDLGRQLQFLDAFAGVSDHTRELSEMYHQRSTLMKEATSGSKALAAQVKERALLTYQLEEIERLGLKSGEEEEIELRLAKLEGAEKLAAESARLLEVTGEGETSIVQLCGQAKHIALGIAKIDREFELTAQTFADLASQAKDLAYTIRQYADALSTDEGELEKLRERRSVLWNLKRKHGLSVDEILARSGEIKQLLVDIERLEQSQAEIDVKLKALNGELLKSAKTLSMARHKAASQMATLVTKRLEPLGFPAPQFDLNLTTHENPGADDVGENGIDELGFLFAANPGTKLQPIANVASGGESSRVTLAIKSVLAQTMAFPLLVYDEVDIGISGKVADQVGAAIAKLAESHQILAVTHLPQIAARAEFQLMVSKESSQNGSVTSAHFLNRKERVEAIASLISGMDVTEKARATANELLRMSGKLQTA